MEISRRNTYQFLSKLTNLLISKFALEKRVRKRIEFLVAELMMTQAHLDEVAAVPRGHNSEVALVWANIVQELSYAIEDIADTFAMCVEGHGKLDSPKNKAKKLLKKTTRLFKKSYDLHRLSYCVEKIAHSAQDCARLRETFIHSTWRPDIGASFLPCVMPLFTDMTELIGIEDSREKFINMLSFNDDWSKHPLKTVSIVGFGGSGKTTLAKVAYDEIKGQFDCSTFVSVSRNPDTKDVLQNILFGLDKNKYAHIRNEVLEEHHLIDKLIQFLNGKRYLIVIDNIWDESLWGIIKNAFASNNNLGSRIITTTRIISVSKACCSSANDSIYQMEPLSDDDSRKLLYARIFGSLSRYPPEFEQVSNDILKKCGGVPVAIIAMASVLARHLEMKTKDQWHALLKIMGHVILENSSAADLQRILWLSYYDLPPHLRICLLYLSTFPGTHPIEKHRLVKKLIAEGKVNRKTKLIGTLNKKEAKLSQEVSLEEAASQYLNELVDWNVIHPLEYNNNGEVITYHIHPMLHDILKAIAIKENFAAFLGDKDISRLLLNPHGMNFRHLCQPHRKRKFRHLSIDCTDSESPTDISSMTFDGRVNSLTFFGRANRILLRHCEVIRILDLEGCQSIERADVECICSIVGLKQLCLANTDITELPPQIGKLPFLEGLDLEGSRITQLPPQIGNLQYLKRLYLGGTQITQLPPEIFRLHRLETLDARKSRVKDLPDEVVQLTRLVHLLVGDNESCEGVKLPDGFGKMTSLEQLGTIDLRKCSASSLEELAELPYLKEIAVVSSDEQEDARMYNALLCSLNESIKKSSLAVYSDFRLSTVQSSSGNKYLDHWKKHIVLRFLKVPIDFAGQHLCMLDIRVCKLEEDGLKILGKLPRLQSLIVRLEVLPTKMIHISSEGFAKLERFYVDCRMPRVIFEEGAMPKLDRLELKLYNGSATGVHMVTRHLLNLQKVTLRYSKWYATNKGVRETTEAVKTEAKEHQNKITLCIVEEGKDGECVTKTEIFEENKGASYSKMTEIEEDGHADTTAYFLNGRDNTQEGDLHQSSRDVAGCTGASEIEEVVA